MSSARIDVARTLRSLFALSVLTGLIVTQSACGDVAQESQGTAACDAAYCVDCADPCCMDLGYC